MTNREYNDLLTKISVLLSEAIEGTKDTTGYQYKYPEIEKHARIRLLRKVWDLWQRYIPTEEEMIIQENKAFPHRINPTIKDNPC